MRLRGGKDVSFAQRAAKIACLRLKELTKFNSFFLRASRRSGNGIFKLLRALSTNREKLTSFMTAVACNARTDVMRAEFFNGLATPGFRVLVCRRFSVFVPLGVDVEHGRQRRIVKDGQNVSLNGDADGA